MADIETKRIIEVETRQTGTTLADLATELDKAKMHAILLNKEVANGTATEEEYQQALVKVKVAQQQYGQEMRIQVKENQAVKGSYNDLVQQLARLKEEWKSAELGSDKFNEVTKKVAEVKDRLKDYDATIGNFQRNVGNYAMESNRNVEAVNKKWGDVRSSLAAVSPAAGKAANGINGLVGSFKVLSTTPAIAVLGYAVTLLTKLAGQFKDNEVAANKFSYALAPLKAWGNAAATAMGELAERLGDVAIRMSEAVSKMPKWSEMGEAAKAAIYATMPAFAEILKSLDEIEAKGGSIAERTKEEQKIVREEIFLRERQRAVSKANAEADLEASKLRKQAAEVEGRARAKLLKEADTKYLEIAQRNISLAKQELRLAEMKAAQAPNSIAANDALAAARVKVLNAEKAYYDHTRETASGILAAEKQKAAASNERADALERELNAIRALAGENAETEAALAAETDAVMTEYEERRKMEERAAADRAAATAAEVAGLDAVIDGQLAQADAERRILAQRQDNIQAYASAVSSILDDVAGAYQSQIKAEVDAGKISEQVGEQRFKAVKALQYANTMLNTYAAVQAVFADPTPKPTALRWTEAAAALTAGIANAVKIAQTSLSSTAQASATGQGLQQITTAAPVTQEVVQTTRVITNAEDTQRLAGALNGIHAYVVTSEYEGVRKCEEAARTESSF